MSTDVKKPAEGQALIRMLPVDMNKSIIVRSADGSEIRRIISKMGLSVQEGTLVKIMNAKKAWGDRPAQPATLIPTATAYMSMAAKCGVCLDHPDSVIVNGVQQPNGYRSPEGTYYFRSRAGGYTQNGQPFVTDRTIDFDVKRYNIQDLLAKAKQDNNSKYFKVKPNMGKNEKTGMLLGAPGDDWAGYPIDDSVVLWVDCSCSSFIGWLSEMNNRIKNAIRVAQTFADRNAIASHPALPIKKKFGTTETTLDCISWFASKGTINFKQLEAHGGAVTIDAQAITIDGADDNIRSEVKADEKGEVLDEQDGSAVEEEDEEEEQTEKKDQPKADTAKKPESKPDFNRGMYEAEILDMEKGMANGPKKRARQTMDMAQDLAVDKMTDDQIRSYHNLLTMAM
jgi:hypothetical protein